MNTPYELDFSNMLHATLRDRYQAMVTAIYHLAAALGAQSRDYQCWVAVDPADDMGHKESVLWIYQQLFYQPKQDKSATLYRPGFLATDAATLTLATQVNTAKDNFYHAMQEIKKAAAQQRNTRQAQQEIAKVAQGLAQYAFANRDPGQAEALRRAKIGTLHLTQAYRHIPVLDKTPLRIGFSWARQSRIVKSISRAELAHFLEYVAAKEDVMARYEALAKDAMVAKVRRQAPHVRANVSYHWGMAQPIPASIPILFAVDHPEHRILFQGVPYDPSGLETNRKSRKANRVDYANPIIEDKDKGTGIYPYLP